MYMYFKGVNSIQCGTLHASDYSRIIIVTWECEYSDCKLIVGVSSDNIHSFAI